MTDNLGNLNEANDKFKEERRCCSNCVDKRRCHICRTETLTICCDCGIDLNAKVYVCNLHKVEHRKKFHGSFTDALDTARQEGLAQGRSEMEKEIAGLMSGMNLYAYRDAIDKVRDELTAERERGKALVEALQKIDKQKMVDLSDDLAERSMELGGLWASLKMIAHEALAAYRGET